MISWITFHVLCLKKINDELLKSTMNPVAQAAIIKGDTSEAVKDILLLDVALLSLGIETTGEIMIFLIPSSTTIPAKKSQTFTIFSDNHYFSILIHIFILKCCMHICY